MTDLENLDTVSRGPLEDKGRGPSTAREGSSTIRVPIEGLRPNQVKEWYANFAPYRNLAGNDKIAKKALGFARQVKENHDNATLQIKEKWRVLNYLLQGNTITDWEAADAVHVPELYKLREALVPRIEEVLLGSDPWFTVRGREHMDEREAWRLKAFLDYQCDKSGINRKMPYAIRTALTHGFCAFKTRWDVKTDYRVKRTVEREESKKGSLYTIKREQDEVVVWERPQADLIDPFWFGIDPASDDPQEASYVFDTSLMSYDRIAALGEQGIFENWKDLASQEPRHAPLALGAQHREDRMGVGMDDGAIRRPDGAPKEFEVTEIWGRFDIYGTGRTRECVITVANGTTVLRCQENPHDDKHRPYCVARLNKDPFNFYAVGPLDHGIPLQVELDTVRQIGQEASRLAQAPIILADQQGSNLPDSILGVDPGSVLDCDVDKIHVLNVAVNPAYMERMDSILRRDMEETIGAPRVFEGTGDGSGTATEVERKIQEGNKRVRGYIRAFTTMLEDLLGQFHSLNRQFVTRDMTFRVLGKAAAGLKQYEVVGPQSFGPDIDFEFVGISNLHTAGLEATNLLQFFNATSGILSTQPGILNVDAFLDLLYERMVGKQPGRRIINLKQDEQDMLSQRDENVLLLQGHEVDVHELDDDMEHMLVLADEFLSDREAFEAMSPHVKDAIMQHFYAHQVAARGKAVREQAAQNQAQQGQDMAFPGQGTVPGGQDPNPAQTPQGETPGPTNMMRQRKPGRQQGFSQSDNMMGAQ